MKYGGPGGRIPKQSQTWQMRYRTVTDVLPSLYVRRSYCTLTGNRSKWGIFEDFAADALRKPPTGVIRFMG